MLSPRCRPRAAGRRFLNSSGDANGSFHILHSAAHAAQGRLTQARTRGKGAGAGRGIRWPNGRLYRRRVVCLLCVRRLRYSQVDNVMAKNIERAKQFQRTLWKAAGWEWTETDFDYRWIHKPLGADWDNWKRQGLVPVPFCAYCGDNDLTSGSQWINRHSLLKVPINLCAACYAQMAERLGLNKPVHEDSEHIDLYSVFSRDEISAFKRAVVDARGLNEATKLLHLPETRLRASIYPTTRRLYKVWTVLGFSHIFFLVIFPIILFIFTRWYWALASILFDITIVHWIHKAVNLELFTRIHFTDKLMAGMAGHEE